MKTKTLFLSSLVAAAAMSTVPAFADNISPYDSENNKIDWVSADNAYKWVGSSSGAFATATNWVTGTGLNGDSPTWSDTNKAPVRVSGKGYLLYFDGTRQTISVSGGSGGDSIATSDGGGIWVTGTGNTVTASLGNWAGCIQVDAGNVLNTSWITKLKDGHIIANGTVNVTSGNLNLDGSGERTWFVGADGSITFSTATTISDGTITLLGEVDALSSGITNRTASGTETLTKQLVAFSSSTGITTGLDLLTVSTISDAGTGTALESATSADSLTVGQYYADKSSSGVTVSYAVNTYTAETLTWAGTESSSVWVNKGDNWTNASGVKTSFLNGDSVIFNTANADVTVSGTVAPGAMTVSQATTLSGTGTVSVAQAKLTLNAALTLGDAVALDLGSGSSSLGSSSSKLALSGTGTVKYSFTSASEGGTGSGIYISDDFAGTVDYTGCLNYGTNISIGSNATLKFSSRTGQSDEIWGNANTTIASKLFFATDYGVNVAENTLTLSGAVSNAGTITKKGSGTLNISGAGTSISDLRISAGSVNITAGEATIKGGQSLVGNLTIGGNATVKVGQTDSLQYEASNTITVNSGGTLDLGTYRWTVGSNNKIVVAGGTITGTGDGNGALDFYRSGGVTATATSEISANVKIRNEQSGTTGTFAVDDDAKLTLSGNVFGAGSLAKTGNGTLALAGTNTFTGNLTVSAGALEVASTGSLTLLGTTTLSSAISNSGTVTVNSTAVFVLDALKTADNTYTVISGGTISGWDSLVAKNFILDGAVVSGRSEVDVTTAGVAKISVEAWNLYWNGGASSVDWNTTETNTIWGKDSAGGDATAFVSGDNVTFNTDSAVTVTVDSSGVTAGTMTVSAGTVTLSGGKVTTAGGITVNGTGTLKISSKTSIGGNVTVGTGGTFDVNGSTSDIGSNIGTITLKGGTLTNTGADVSTQYKQLYTLAVTADSEINGSGNFGLIGSQYAGTKLNLGGNTLTKTGDNTFWLVNTEITGNGGTLEATAGTLGGFSGKSVTLGDGVSLKTSGTAGTSALAISSMGAKSNLTLAGTTASTVAISGAVGDGASINVSEGNAVSGTISSMGAGSSLTLAGTTASAVAISGAVGDGASINVSEGSAVTWTHNGADRSTTATITIGEGSSFKDNSNFKYDLALSGKLSGAGTLISGVATTDGQGDDFRDVTLSGSTADFTGTWELETASSTASGNRRINGILNSSDGVFGGVISFTDSSADSSKTSSTLSLAKDMAIGGLKGTLSNTIVKSSDTTARALTINTVAGASYDYAGTIASTISSLTKTGTGTQTLSGDNSAFTGNVDINAGTLVAGSASALGTGTTTVESGAKLGLVAGTTVEVAGGITLAEGAKIVIDMSDVSETESFTLDLITGTKLTYNSTTITGENVNTTLKNAIEFSGWGESLNDWTQKLAFDNESKKLSLSLTKIPEPSAFGLLAGVGALVFVAARRRRRAK